MAPKKRVIFIIGKTGVGKSAFGNGYLRAKKFITSESPSSCTLLTSSCENVVNGRLRIVIDSQGLEDTEGLDGENVAQMIEFLRQWDDGVNAIGIVINGQDPKLDMGTQKLLKLIHVLFNDDRVWNSVFIVFTRWYNGIMTENQRRARRVYAEEVRAIAHKCIGRTDVNPQIPCFFVDAKDDINDFDIDTRDEYAAIDAFALGREPLSTKNFAIPNVHYFKIIPEFRDNYFVSETISDDKMTRTRVFANQTRNRQISYDDVESFSEWIDIDSWTEVNKKTIKEVVELRRKINETIQPVNRTVRTRRRIGGIFGPRGSYEVFDHNRITTTYEDRKRYITTDFDGQEIVGDWIQIRTFKEVVG